jgi:serine/threonine-protein kinase
MYELMEADGTHYITMEYVPGQDLRGLMRQTGHLTVGKAIAVARQVCTGLAEAHRMGIVHRDLKPSNIIVDREGNVRIMDFGIARSLQAKGITGPGIIIGTPEYMSPEQAEAREVDKRTDIYSLGVVLYEMVTGRVPFVGETPLGIIMKHKSEPPQDPQEVNPQVPRDLSRMILKCLEKDKDKRYQSAESLHSELEKMEEGIPSGERTSPQKKPFTSREITVNLRIQRLVIAAAVAAGLIILGIVFIRYVVPARDVTPVGSNRRSIAVLPFEDLSPAKNHEYLCDGMAETLISSLSRVAGLRVPARSSAFSFKGKGFDPRQMGRQLGVETLLEASVQVVGDRLRITPRIIRVSDGSTLWSDLYDRQMADVFAIQDEIAREVVRALQLQFLKEQGNRPVESYTDNLQAYTLYLQGRYLWNKRTPADIRKAADHFNRAIALDPDYALAYVGLADCYVVLPHYEGLKTGDVLPKARDAAIKALKIDDGLAEAHTSLGAIFKDEWDWVNAEKEFKRAIELNANYATAHHWYAILLDCQGRLEEAKSEIQKAIELDPLSLAINVCFGDQSYLRRDYDQAIRKHRKTLELDQDFAIGRLRLAECYLQKGMFEEAIAEFQKVRSRSGDIPFALGDLGNAYGQKGEESRAIETLKDLERLSNQGFSVNFEIALVHFGLGHEERTFERLERAEEENDRGMHWLKVDPRWDRIRHDPRYKSIIRSMNLE